MNGTERTQEIIGRWALGDEVYERVMSWKPEDIKEVGLVEVSLVKDPPHPSYVVTYHDSRVCRNCGSPSHTFCNR